MSTRYLPALWTPVHVGNYARGRPGPPDLIVDHVSEGSLGSMTQWFRDPRAKVSAHYGVGRDGTVLQYVSETDTAWHAGRVLRPTAELVRERPGQNPNGYSIGIEHEGLATDALTPQQLEASAKLHADLARRHGTPLTRRHVVGHREIFAEKTCPGRIDLDAILARAREIAAPPEPRAPELAVPSPAPPDHRADLHLEPIPVPEPPADVSGVGAFFWARDAARGIGAAAASRAREHAGTLLPPALERLKRLLEGRLPGWLLAMVWPLVESEARKALG